MGFYFSAGAAAAAAAAHGAGSSSAHAASLTAAAASAAHSRAAAAAGHYGHYNQATAGSISSHIQSRYPQVPDPLNPFADDRHFIPGYDSALFYGAYASYQYDREQQQSNGRQYGG